MKTKITIEEKTALAIAAKIAHSDPELSDFMDKVQARLDLYTKKPVVEPRKIKH